MKPTIGTIVRYHHEIEVGKRRKDETPQTMLKAFPAIITDVRESQALLPKGDGVEMGPTIEVQLQVFGAYYGNDMGPMLNAYPFSETPKAGHWSWPPEGSNV